MFTGVRHVKAKFVSGPIVLGAWELPAGVRDR